MQLAYCDIIRIRQLDGAHDSKVSLWDFDRITNSTFDFLSKNKPMVNRSIGSTPSTRRNRYSHFIDKAIINDENQLPNNTEVAEVNTRHSDASALSAP